VSVDSIRAMFGYNKWATERVLQCCEQLTPAQFTQKDDTPWGSIRNQLVHQFGVHRSWLSWADGSMSAEEAYALRADPDDYPDVSAVRAFWTELSRQNDAFMDRLTPDVLALELRADGPGYQFAIGVSQLMLHIAHHSMQHRTETAMSLTQQGASPGDIDYLHYALEQG
jgi:uncharacterized damage-inducible protein DinB